MEIKLPDGNRPEDKKGKSRIPTIAVLAGVLLGLGGCAAALYQAAQDLSRTVMYYGCPNSRRVDKLNLKKERRHE